MQDHCRYTLRSAGPRIAIATAAVINIACGGTSSTPTGPAAVVLSSVSVTGIASALTVGQTSQIVVTAAYSDGSHQDLTSQSQFASTNQAVASVSFTGLLTAWANGAATITAEPRNPAVQNFQPTSVAVTVTGAPASRLEMIPTLVSPADNAALPNNCPKDPCNVIWTFTWLPVAGATAYHLNVMHNGAMFPIVDAAEIADTSYQFNLSALGGGISNANLLDWRWMVQAKVQGAYQGWSPFNSFDVLPMSSALDAALRVPRDELAVRR